jgi:50S ribosomal protein uL3
MTWPWEVAEHDHDIQNPTSPEKIRLLGEYLRLTPESRVLDIACGKGGPARILAATFGCRILGIELRPAFAEEARRRIDDADLSELVEIRTADASSSTVGQELTAGLFTPAEGAALKVDVVATSRGKGYAGVMKRHNFRGLGAGHGVKRAHRKPGSVGACATPGRVFKGTRMAGRMGNVRTTTQNLTVHALDAERGLLLLKGAVPGPTRGLVLVRSAVKGGLAPTTAQGGAQ